MITRDFWLDALERALKTGAQTVVATIGGGAVGIFDLDWVMVGSVAALAMVLSLCTSIASAPLSTKGTASLSSNVEYKE